MKPLLVICPGAIKSGTTSLYDHFYTSYLLHFGHGKEHYYLNNIYRNKYAWEEEFKHNFLSEKFFTFRENHTFKSFEPYYKQRTLENYKNYFLEIYEYYVSHKKMFYGVADFSQSYADLSSDQVKHFRDYITEYFDVKIIIMIREPVHRFYSYCNMNSKNAKDFFYKTLNEGKDSQLNLYERLFETWASSQIWGENNHTFVCYENLFGDNNSSIKEISSLYRFLNIPQGPCIKRNKSLIKGIYQTQLSKDDIEFAKNKLRQEYTSFHTRDLLPNHWEYADTWNIDCVKYENLNKQLNPVEYYS